MPGIKSIMQKQPPINKLHCIIEALLMLLLPCGWWEKNTIKHLSETKIHMDESKHMGSMERRKFNANIVLPPPRPLRWGHQYFEQGESIYMVLYFPIPSSGGNPTASPEETDAPASMSLLLILLTRRGSPTHPFPQCVCVFFCAKLCVRSAWGLTLHGHLMCERIKDACVHTGVCVKGCSCSFPVHTKSAHACPCLLCVFVCVPYTYHSDCYVTGCRLSNLCISCEHYLGN